jgi:hypothetical protein
MFLRSQIFYSSQVNARRDCVQTLWNFSAHRLFSQRNNHRFTSLQCLPVDGK